MTTKKPPVELVEISTLRPADPNPNRGDLDAITTSIEANDWYGVIVVNRRPDVETSNMVLAGNHRMAAAQQLGMTELPVWWVDLDDTAARRLMIADNRTAQLADTDERQLLELLQTLADDDALHGSGYDAEDLLMAAAALDAEEAGGMAGMPYPGAGSLRAQFLCPPMTVLDARQGWWRDRKRGWLNIGLSSDDGRSTGVVPNVGPLVSGLASERGRGEDLLGEGLRKISQNGKYEKPIQGRGTSVFDPVLCELVYRWFCPPGGHVLDPMAGGSVRGIVASSLGLDYTGIDLSAQQIAANVEQWDTIGPTLTSPAPAPQWIVGDSLTVLPDLTDGDVEADLIFTCPPYHDLEQYSEDPADLSQMDYPDFLAAYRQIIQLACDRLAPDRFAAIVVGDIRDRDGHYRGFVSDTIQAFTDAGLHLYNEAVLVTPVGYLALTAAKQFHASRKLAKAHQNVLTFVKGDARRATQHCGSVQVPDLEVDEDA